MAMTIATIGRRMKNRPRPSSPALGSVAAGGDAGGRPDAAVAGFSSGLTCMPGRTFWSPSTMTRSPRLSPAVTM